MDNKIQTIYDQWIDALRVNPMFHQMDDVAVLHVLNCLRPKVAKYEPGDLITIGGSAFEGVGLVLEGRVLVTKELITGHRHIMAKLGKKQVFGEMIAFSGRRVWPATVEAITDCTILFLPPDMILGTCTHACTGHNQLIRNMLQIVSSKALRLNRKVEYLTLKGMREKLATYLLETYNTSEKDIFEIPLSREELAAFLNVSRPSMSRELSRMKDEGLIDYHKASFKILDIDLLTEFVS